MAVTENKLCFPTLGELPWLVFTHYNKARKYQTLCSMTPTYNANNSIGQSCVVKEIPELANKRIFACCDGWLILRDFKDNRNFSLYNPSSPYECICLPRFQALDDVVVVDEEDVKDDISTCALTSAPNNNTGNFAILFFFKSMVYSCWLNIKKSRKPLKWTQHSVNLNDQPIESFKHVVRCNGILYGYAVLSNESPHVLFTIELGQNGSANSFYFKPLEVRLPRLPYPGACIHSIYVLEHMLESCGKIYYIYTIIRQESGNPFVREIIKGKIWELDEFQGSWVEVESLGDRAFFLIHETNCSTWCWAGEGVESNSLYYALNHDIIYSYRLDDDSFSFLLPCAKLKTPFFSPCWVIDPQKRSVREVSKRHAVEKVGMNEVAEPIHDGHEMVQGKFSTLGELGQDLIEVVASYLHLFDYMNFRASCKTFYAACPLSRANWSSTFPLLLSNKDNNGLCELRDIFRNDTISIKIPNVPRVPTTIDYCKKGWMILCPGFNKPLIYFNLFTKETRSLPDIEDNQDMHVCESIGFSNSPDSSDCLMVGITWVCSLAPHIVLYTYQLGDEKEECHKFANELPLKFEPVNHCCPVHYKGLFYFLDRQGYLGEFRMKKGNEKATWQVYNRPLVKDDQNVHWRYLVECNGTLLSIFIGKLGHGVQVFKFNYMTKDWVQLPSMGDHILFLSSSSCISVVARDLEMADRIYLPWRKGNDIFFYSLKTCKYYVKDNGDPMDYLCNMEGHSLCCWV